MKRLFLLVQIPDKSENSIRLMIFDMFRRISSLVIEINRKFRVQVSSLVQPALDFLSLESGLLKYRVIRQEVDRCACFFSSCLLSAAGRPPARSPERPSRNGHGVHTPHG